MKDYIPTIGLEIHAELKTQSKMFCPCKNNPEEDKPNINVCPICLGYPGTLPYPNKEAIRHVLKVGLALDGKLADFTEFDRKNYFYPDIPKGYQISQYKYPFISGGKLLINTKNGPKEIELTRIHLEEDTAKSTHDEGETSLVDFNRSGLPLMELVTEPVIKSGEEASMFAKELQLLLRYLGASDANMEKGEMRVEANISISDDPNKFGTKVEVKNLNSFKSVERAVAYEIERHKALLLNGEKIIQETRGFDENTGKTFSQRQKEDSHDYRYFPEPDIPKIFVSKVPDFKEDVLRSSMPELPNAKRERYSSKYKIKKEDIEFFIENQNLANFFESSIENFCDDLECIKLASNYIVSDLAGLMKNNNLDTPGEVFPSSFGKLMILIKENKLSSRGAKDTLAILFKEGGDPEKIAETNGWILKNDPEELKRIVQGIIDSNSNIVAEFKSGKEPALNALVGKVMKEAKGGFSPGAIKETLLQLIS